MSSHPWPVAPAPAFSNGSEWLDWQARWCSTCIHDVNEDCPVVADMLCHVERPELRREHLTIICIDWEQR